MNSSAQFKNTICQRITTWLVLVGFVFQLGAGSCGCFEHNGWVRLLESHVDGSAAAVSDTDYDSHAAQHKLSHHLTNHADTPYSCVDDLHECKPLAFSNALLTETVRLPTQTPEACALDQWDTYALDHRGNTAFLIGGTCQNESDGGPARLVTQAFLI